jgi:probable F420-dependent oxidoreductase
MKIDTTIMGPLLDTGARARAAEDLGFDGVWVAETAHDPFLALGSAAATTERVALGTNIVVAFARSPMTVAMTANDLQLMSGGRLILGLGSQIKPHITRRFNMPWSDPANRMKEYIGALRAIWDCWQTGEKLDFRGEYYQHTLMTPMFSPGPHEFGAPAVYLAAVGPLMLRVAAEVADGLLCHPFSTDRYLREVIVPSLAAVRPGLADFAVCAMPIVVTGRDETELAASATAARRQIAFYASTPAYRPVLDLHGWGSIGDEMHALSLEGRWVEMGERLDDEVLHAIAVVAEPDRLAGALAERFGDVMTRCALSTLAGVDPSVWAPALAELGEH